MATTSTQYQSYLLRLWLTEDNSKLRATLISVHNPDEQHHFATLDELTLFLNDSFVNDALVNDPAFQRKEAGNEIDGIDGIDEIDEEGEGDVGHRGSHRYRSE